MTKVNKENWEYKKLGDICEILDSRRKPVTKEKREKGEYPYYGSTGIQDYVSSYLFDGRFLLLGEDGGKWGKYERSSFIAEGKIWVNNHTHILKFSKDLLYKFVMYYLNYKDLSAYITGAVVPKLTQANMRSIMLPIPSLKEQDYITNLFDRVTNLITLKQKQLKEFDSLEQSVFYKMFGDLYSEMKWKTSLLKDVITLRNGRAYKQEELLPSGKYKVLRVGNFFSNNKFYYSDLELEDNKYCNPGDLLYTWSASFGARIWSGERCIYHYHIWRVDFDENIFNKIFLLYMLNNLTDLFKERLHGVGMMHLTKQMMEEKIIPLPPLSLQQSFAQKIEVIEKQKEVVKNEIAQLQALLARWTNTSVKQKTSALWLRILIISKKWHPSLHSTMTVTRLRPLYTVTPTNQPLPAGEHSNGL